MVLTSENSFYRQGAESLKLQHGELSGIWAVVRVTRSLNDSIQAFGELRRVGDQLFVETLPELGAGSYVQIRQDGENIDLEVVCPASSQPIRKSGSWHHQPGMSGNLYYTDAIIDSARVEIGIGSPWRKLLPFFEEKTLANLWLC